MSAVPGATYYRRLAPPAPGPKPSPAGALSSAERLCVFDVLHEPGFAYLAAAQVHAQLLDKGQLLCSERI